MTLANIPINELIEGYGLFHSGDFDIDQLPIKRKFELSMDFLNGLRVITTTNPVEVSSE